jgi:hypothetical protein
MPYLILCEGICAWWLLLNNRSFVTTYWWGFVASFASLVFLAAKEHRANLPLPFIDDIALDVFLGTFLVAIFAFGTMPYLVGLFHPYLRRIPLAFVNYGGMITSAHAGIFEESLKVMLTNLVPMGLQKKFEWARLERKGRIIVYVAGTCAVILWASLHVPLRGYDLDFVVTASLAGMVCFFLILRTRNYLPIVVAHFLYDAILKGILIP